MKKILFCLIFAALGVAASAQAPFGTAYLMPTVAHDTIKTGNLTVTKIFQATAGYSNVSVQVNVTKVSGTCNGNVRLYGSLDGTNYQEVTTADSLHFGNASTFKIWTVTGSPYVYYKVYAIQHNVATVAKIQVYQLFRKRPITQ